MANLPRTVSNPARTKEQKDEQRAAAREKRRMHRPLNNRVTVSAGAAKIIARACGVDHDTEYHHRDPKGFDETWGRFAFQEGSHRPMSAKDAAEINHTLAQIAGVK